MLTSAAIYLFVLSTLYYIALGQHLSNISSPLIVKKCKCPGTQVYQANVCKEAVSNLSLLLWDPVAVKVNFLDLKKQSHIIQPLSCGHGFSKKIFYERAFFLKDGELLTASMNATEDYCIENDMLENGSIEQRIEVCVENLELPLCCNKNEFLNENNHCTPSYDSVQPKWPENFYYVANRPLNCGELNLNGEHLQLEYKGDVNAMFNFFQHRGIDFCLGQHEGLNGTHKPVYLLCDLPEHVATTSQMLGVTTLVPFCCPDKHAFDMDVTHKCISHQESVVFPSNIIFNQSEIIPIASRMNCTGKPILESFIPGEHFTIQKDGSLRSEYGLLMKQNEYCLGVLIKNNESLHSGLSCFDSVGFICPWRYVLLQVSLLISSFFYVLILPVHLLVSSLRKKIGSACLVSKLIALLISQVNLLVLQFGEHHMDSTLCLTTGLIEVISVLASFSWLNVMCFDLWKGLRIRVILQYRPVSFKVKRFLRYSVYAWGCPLLIGTIALLLEWYDSPIRPNFTPQDGCYFRAKDSARQWGYMHGFILATLLVNLSFFLHLAMTVVPYGLKASLNETYFWEDVVDNFFDIFRENFILYLKLFLLMAIPWVVEVSTFFAEGETLCYLRYLDIVYALRGILIFGIFVSKKKVVKMFQVCKRNKDDPEKNPPAFRSVTDASEAFDPLSMRSLFYDSENTQQLQLESSVSDIPEDLLNHNTTKSNLHRVVFNETIETTA